MLRPRISTTALQDASRLAEVFHWSLQQSHVGDFLASCALHRLTEHGIYFVTAATLHHAHHFRTKERLEVLHRGLLKVCADYGWRLEAWAVFSNHYHFVAESPGMAESLPAMLGNLAVDTPRR